MNSKITASFEIPILMLVFNRPNHTQKVLERILEINPSKIYVVADGPRVNREDDHINSKATRALFSNLRGDVEIITHFRDENLGCRKSVSEGISWFFAQEEMGIILEDDCLPDLSFFTFASNLLHRYVNEPRVMHISANNFQPSTFEWEPSYYFSQFPHIWGWATWRRAWNGYSSTLDNISKKDFGELLDNNFLSWNQKQVFKDKYELVKLGEIDTWDYQWMFHIWNKEGLCITPKVNLVKNIGFDASATHTVDASDKFADMHIESIDAIFFDDSLDRHVSADQFTYQNNWHKNAFRNMYRLLRRNLIKCKK